MFEDIDDDLDQDLGQLTLGTVCVAVCTCGVVLELQSVSDRNFKSCFYRVHTTVLFCRNAKPCRTVFLSASHN